MKRYNTIQAILIAAALTVAGCSIDREWDNSTHTTTAPQMSSKPITIDYPLVSPVLRSAVSAYFDTSRDFAISAVWHKTLYSSWTATGTYPWLMETVFSYDAQINGWSAAGAYWPKSGGYMSFQAYSPASLHSSAGLTFDHTGLNLTNYVQSDPTIDILYSDRAVNCTKTDDIDHNTSDNIYHGVQLVFHHALANLTFLPRIEGANVTVMLKQIEVTDCNNTASFAQNLVATDAASSAGTPAWTSPSNATSYTTIMGSEIALESTCTDEVRSQLNELCIIPQTINDDMTINIDYTIQIGSGTPIEQYISKRIVDILPKDIDDQPILTSFESGHRYTFNVIIAPNKIYFDATAKPWGTGQTNSNDDITM